MANPQAGKKSRKKRRTQREKSERASQKGLPSRPVAKPASKRRKGASSAVAKRTRKRYDPDRDGARRAIDGEPDFDSGAVSVPTIRDRIARLPAGAKIGAVAALLLISIWVVAQVRDRGQAPVATPASQEQIPPRSEPESVAPEVEQMLAEQPDLAQSAAAPDPLASAGSAVSQPTPSASVATDAPMAEPPADTAKKKKKKKKPGAQPTAAAATPAPVPAPKPAAPAPPAVPPKPAPPPRPAPAEENPY